MKIGSGSFSSSLLSWAELQELDGLSSGALSKLGGLDKGMLKGGFGQLDKFGGVGGLGGDLVKSLFGAAGMGMLQGVARLLSQAGVNGSMDGAQQRGSCGSCGNKDPMSNNIQGGGSGAPADSAMAKLGPNACFEDLVEAFMTDEVKKMREEIKEEMRKLQKSNKAGEKGGAGGAGGKGGAGGAGKAGGGGQQEKLNQLDDKSDSRQDMMEAVKNLMNKLQQIQQAMSNTLNAMHQGAMNCVRNIKG